MASYSIVAALTIFLLVSAYGASVQKETSEVVNPQVPSTLSNNIHDCINPSNNKTILYTATVAEQRNLLSYVTKTITYPSSGIGTSIITCIVVTDKSETGAYASITDGGLGNNYVEITLKSAWNKALNFNIQIYADESS